MNKLIGSALLAAALAAPLQATAQIDAQTDALTWSEWTGPAAPNAGSAFDNAYFTDDLSNYPNTSMYAVTAPAAPAEAAAVTAVPEPDGWSMALAGVLLVGLTMFRRTARNENFAHPA